MSRRQRRSKPSQKTIQVWLPRKDANKQKRQCKQSPEIDMISSVGDEQMKEEPSKEEMAEELEQLQRQISLMKYLMGTLTVPNPILKEKEELSDKAAVLLQEQNPGIWIPSPVPPSQLLPGLVAAGLITPIPLRAIAGSSSSRYNPCCDFHMGSPGHETDKCFSLRHIIQNLIDQHLLNFRTKEESAPHLSQGQVLESNSSGPVSVNDEVPHGKRRFDPSLLLIPIFAQLRFIQKEKKKPRLLLVLEKAPAGRRGIKRRCKSILSCIIDKVKKFGGFSGACNTPAASYLN